MDAMAYYDGLLPSLPTSSPVRLLLALAGLLAAGAAGAHAVPQRPAPGAYTVFLKDGRKSLPVRTAGGIEMVSLNQLTGFFGLAIAEDAMAGGITIDARGQRIVLIPGQSFASVAGRVVSLSRAVERDRTAWQVPIDFLAQALGPALNLRIDLRPVSRLIVVGDVRVPRVSGRFDRQGPNGRLVFDIEPPAPHRVTREGKSLLIRFDAEALDPGPLPGPAAEFVTAIRIEGVAIRIDLGPSAAGFAANDDPGQTRLTIELTPPAPPPPPPPPPPAALPGPVAGLPPGVAQSLQAPPAQAPPVIDPAPGSVRVIVIDPGHGGDDEGVKGAGGAKEKDVALQIARRLKAAIESRIGLRVLLTREGDEPVSLDRRAAFANNNKADLFVSLHANASVRPAVRGAQVFSLSLEDYKDRAMEFSQKSPPVPLVGGGLRAIDPVPWDIAQLPFADRSAMFAATVVKHLTERAVPLHGAGASLAPLRVLVGANMPAILIEMGFLSNAGDEAALTGADVPGALIEAILSTIADVRYGFPLDPSSRVR
jgi:N-acetylmuramoyl-L-alanine amidase